MVNLSLPQEFFLLNLKSNGKFPAATSHEFGALLASVLIEFNQQELIVFSEKKFEIKPTPFPAELEYLSPVYQILEELKKKTATALANKYFTFSDKNYKVLTTNIINTLTVKGIIQREKSRGILGERIIYHPSNKEKDRIIQRIRAELLEEGLVSPQTAALVFMMNRLKKLDQYFSKYESGTLKDRVKELKKTQENQIVKDILDHLDMIYAAMIIAAAT